MSVFKIFSHVLCSCVVIIMKKIHWKRTTSAIETINLILLLAVNPFSPTFVFLTIRDCLGSVCRWKAAMRRPCPSRRPYSCIAPQARMDRQLRCSFERQTKPSSCQPPCCQKCPDKRIRQRCLSATRTRRRCSLMAPSTCFWPPHRSILPVSQFGYNITLL